MKKTAFIAVLLTAAILAVTLGGCQLFGGEKIELDKTAISMVVGDSVSLSAGKASRVTWSSSDDKIAAVNGGTVTGKSAGTAVITASLENGDSAKCTVTVSDKLITGVSVTPQSTRVELGKTVQLRAVYSPPDATDNALEWVSADEGIASVDSDGYVTGRSEGATVISCRSTNGVEGSCAVTVGASIEPPTIVKTEPSTEAPTQEPTKSDTADSSSSSSASAPGGIYPDDFIFPDSSSRRLSDSEISERFASMSGASVSGSYAQDAINEIFARNGYVFRTKSIGDYYASKPWYKADAGFSPDDLNDTEEYNISLFRKY